MQKRNRTIVGMLSWILCVGLLTGCGAKMAMDSAAPMENYSSGSSNQKYESMVEMDAALGDAVEMPSLGTSGSGVSTDSLQAVSSRKLITTVTMDTETETYDDLMAWLSARIAEYGGYVEYSESSGNQSTRRYQTLTIRIPATNLDVFLTGLSQESNVTYQSRSVKDITLQYVDVASHKEALLVEQQRLMELLEKANNLEDLLKIESRLTQVRYELESYESQLRTYDNQIDYSTIHLSIREVKVLTAPEPEGFWARVTDGFRDDLKDVTEDLTEFAIDFLSSIPTLTVWAVILVVIGVILAKVRKVCRNRRRKQAAEGFSVADGTSIDSNTKKKSKKCWGRRNQSSPQKCGNQEYTGEESLLQQKKKDGE